MPTLTGSMAGLDFSIRAPDDLSDSLTLESLKNFLTLAADADCVCEIQESADPPVEVTVGRGLPVFGHRKSGDMVEIYVVEAGREIKVGDIDGKRLRGTFYDVSPNNFQTLFFMYFRAFVQICLLNFDGLLVHGCGIVKGGKGYLLMGQSNTGKTTIARKFNRREVLSDEVICVRREGGRWKIFSTFWRVWNTGGAELSRIFVLHRDEKEPEMRRLMGAESAARLSLNPYTTPDLFGHPEKLLEILEGLAIEVPCFSLRINPEKFKCEDVISD